MEGVFREFWQAFAGVKRGLRSTAWLRVSLAFITVVELLWWMNGRRAFALGRVALFISFALLVAFGNACAQTATHPEDEAYSAASFQITNENVMRVTAVEEQGAVSIVTAEIGACAWMHRGGTEVAPKVVLRVRGAPSTVFYVGRLIATGAGNFDGRRVPAVRIVTPADLKALGCHLP